MNLNFISFRLRWLPGVVLLAAAAVASAAPPRFTLGSVRAVPGGPASLGVNLASNQTAVALQFELQHGGSLTTTGFVAASAVSNFTVRGVVMPDGRSRIIVYSASNAPAPVGSLLTAALTVATNAANGTNVVTLENVIATDGSAGDLGTTPVATGTVVVYGAPDRVRPTVTLMAPLANARVPGPVVVTRGTARDTLGLKEVQVSLNGGPFATALGSSNWSLALLVRPGTNVIRVQSVDYAGNVSLVATRLFTFPVTNRLVLVAGGPGRITGATNGQPVELGRAIQLTARPDANALFLGWTTNGVPATTNVILRTAMSSNLTIGAAFIPSPFPAVAGTYRGLFHPTNAVRPTNAGAFQLSITPSGGASGRLQLGGATLTVPSLQFDLAGRAQSRLTVGRSNQLVVNWLLDLNRRDGLGGQVTDGRFIAPLEGYRESASGAYRGSYSFLIPGAASDLAAPAGVGAGTATIDTRGNVTLAGVLPDGTTFNQSGPLNHHGDLPLYVSLDAGRTVLLGWVHVSGTNEVPAGNIASDRLFWFKGTNGTGKFYPAGFSLEAQLLGGRWLTVTNLARQLGWTNGLVKFNGGNLRTGLTNRIALAAKTIQFVGSNTNKITLTINPATGLVNGTLVHPVTGKVTPFKGAMLQSGIHGVGGAGFNGTNRIGSILIEPVNVSREEE